MKWIYVVIEVWYDQFEVRFAANSEEKAKEFVSKTNHLIDENSCFWIERTLYDEGGE